MSEASYEQQTIWTRTKKLKELFNYFLLKNIYRSEPSLSIREQTIATRLYFGLLCISLTILFVLAAARSQTLIVTIQSPSLAKFDALITQYPSTASCPCSQVTIPYSKFLSFAPRYHQICSSEFVSESWMSALFSINTTNYFPLDFRTSASSQFQVIALLCNVVAEYVSNTLEVYGYQELISIRALPRSAFDAQSKALVQQLQSKTVIDITNMDQFVFMNIANNHLVSALHTNYIIYSVPGSRMYTTVSDAYLPKYYTTPIKPNIVCNCEYSHNCVSPSGFFNKWTIKEPLYYLIPDPQPEFYVPGIMSGCLPRYSISQSTMECFYEASCLIQIQTLIGDKAIRHPLNTTIESRFQPNDTIDSIFNELFIESWNDASNFTGYYHTCEPKLCSYTYEHRFYIVYVFITLFGLIGGLTTTLYSAVKYFIQYALRYALLKLSRSVEVANPVATVLEHHSERRFQTYLISIKLKIKQAISSMNLFEETALELNNRQSIWATRVYLVSLLSSVLFFGIRSSIMLYTFSSTVNNPSQAQFEKMHAQYPLTLSCPCSKLSVPYSNFMTIKPRFHQICASDFIRSESWLLYFTFVPLKGATLPTGVFYPLDFRQSSGASLFYLTDVLCRSANQTISYSLEVFANTEFFSSQPLPASEFNEQTSSIIQQFEEQTLASYLALLSLVRTSIEDNDFYVASVPNFAQSSFQIYYSASNYTWALRYKPKIYNLPDNKTCSCLTSQRCVRSQGFYCASPDCHQVTALPNQTIPGLVSSCFPVNSLLFSTFECFYNQACVQMLLDWRLFDIEQFYESFTSNVTALDYLLPSRFTTTTTMNEIALHLMIEDWINTTNITAHYQQCNPNICTYTYTDHYGPLELASNTLGIVGGLSIVLRLLVPLIVIVISSGLLFRQTTEVASLDNWTIHGNHWSQKVKFRLKQIAHSILKMNLFNNEIEHPIMATRIYLVVLGCSFLTVLTFTGLNQQPRSVVLNEPSEIAFKAFQNQYEMKTVSCPCRQTSLSYSRFLSISTNYHQICSSRFIEADWWTLVASDGDTYVLKDQPLLGAYFRMLGSFCILANQTINDAIQTFMSKTSFGVEALTRESFESQVSSSLNVFFQQTPLTFRRMLKYIRGAFRSNQLQNMFMTTWNIAFTTAEENYIVATIPRSFNNGTCSCTTSLSPTCWRPLNLVLYNTTITIPGLVGSCLPVDGLRRSTLECLFDSSCLSTLRTLLNSSAVLYPLNATVATRFPHLTTQLSSIIDELFVEEWTNVSNFSSYYQGCSPQFCEAKFSESKNIIYMITTLLSFYSGLTICLRFFVLHCLRIFKKVLASCLGLCEQRRNLILNNQVGQIN